MSGRVPPTSGERESFPSENAPAPANPVEMEQGLHPMQTFVFLFGHVRFSIERPFSSIRTFKSGLFCISSYAQKIPDGPAPIIITSYIFLVFAIFKYLRFFCSFPPLLS